jgi:hypothetical protein
MSSLVDKVNKLINDLNESMDRPELSEARIRVDDSLVSEMSKKELSSIAVGFKRASDEIDSSIDRVRQILSDYEDENGSNPDFKSFLGMDNARRILDTSNFLEALGAVFDNAARKAK